MPDEIKKEIFDYSRLNAVDLDKLTKFKAAKSIEIAADNDGTAGAGLGYAVAGMMGHMLTGTNINSNQSTPVPPAITFFMVINGEQAGPYDMNSLKQMAAQGQLTKETLVWQAGMENWTPAGQLPHLNSVFGSVPPPIPQ